MAAQVTRRAMIDWLRRHGFQLQPGKATGHQHWVKGSCKITVPGHGPSDLTKKHVALTIRALEKAGFNRDDVRKELGS